MKEDQFVWVNRYPEGDIRYGESCLCGHVMIGYVLKYDKHDHSDQTYHAQDFFPDPGEFRNQSPLIKTEHESLNEAKQAIEKRFREFLSKIYF